FFFFSSRRRHTRFSRDWSSDVCSSDLASRTARSPIAWTCTWKPCRSSSATYSLSLAGSTYDRPVPPHPQYGSRVAAVKFSVMPRSEERRVGKEGRCRWSADHEETKRGG